MFARLARWYWRLQITAAVEEEALEGWAAATKEDPLNRCERERREKRRERERELRVERDERKREEMGEREMRAERDERK